MSITMWVHLCLHSYHLTIIVFAISSTGVVTLEEPLDRELVSW